MFYLILTKILIMKVTCSSKITFIEHLILKRDFIVNLFPPTRGFSSKAKYFHAYRIWKDEKYVGTVLLYSACLTLFTFYKTWEVENILAPSYPIQHINCAVCFCSAGHESRKHISTVIFHSVWLTYTIRFHSTGHGKLKTLVNACFLQHFWCECTGTFTDQNKLNWTLILL